MLIDAQKLAELEREIRELTAAILVLTRRVDRLEGRRV